MKFLTVGRLKLSVRWSRHPRAGLILAAVIFTASCDSPEKHALRQLSREGIEPSGRALVEAVAANKSQQIRWLLDVNVHTEQRDGRGHTPLRIAIDEGYSETAVLLLRHGAEANASSPDGAAMLGSALKNGLPEVVRELIQKRAKADGKMPGGQMILVWAIQNGRVDEVRLMFQNGADPHVTDEFGNPLLHVAIHARNFELVKILIENGADPGMNDAAGNSSVALALQEGLVELLPPLAQAGADPNLPSPSGKTLLEQAIEKRDTATIAMLLKIGADPVRLPTTKSGVTPLEAAVMSGVPEVLEAILKPGEFLNGPEWGTALWLAYRTNNFELASTLLRRGAHARQARQGGLLLTESATISQKISWLKALLDYGHPSGKSIYYAASAGDYLTTRFLLDRGASADFTKIPSKDTALSAAILVGNDTIAELLLERGANANLRLPGGPKLLHLAIVLKRPETVRSLIAAGADPNELVEQPVGQDFLKNVPSKDMQWYLSRDRNITPLMLAANSGIVATAEYLLDAGARKNVYTQINYTWPINFASRRSDLGMMRLLLGQNPHTRGRKIILSLKEQRARFYSESGDEIFSTRVSSGRSGYRTLEGEFVITDKHRDHSSTIYGSSMPYFQRLSCSDFGFHYGVLPGYPASHGCIRIPMDAAKKLFALTEVGDVVIIKQ